jgi:hypothetical protein
MIYIPRNMIYDRKGTLQIEMYLAIVNTPLKERNNIVYSTGHRFQFCMPFFLDTGGSKNKLECLSLETFFRLV